MKVELSKIISNLPVKLLTISRDLVVTGAYTSDLLSDVIANAKEKQIWITLHNHINIVAVAALKELAAIIVTGGYIPDEKTIEKAKQEEIPIYTTTLCNFEISGKIYKLIS